MEQPAERNRSQSRRAAEILNAFRHAIAPLGLAIAGEAELVTEFGRAQREIDTLRLTLTDATLPPPAAPRAQSEVLLSWSEKSDVVEVEAYARVFVPGSPPDPDALASQAFAAARDRALEVDACRIGLEYLEGRPDPARFSVALTHEYTFTWQRAVPLREGNADVEQLCGRLRSAMDGLLSMAATCQ